jgi:hypothetical protein
MLRKMKNVLGILLTVCFVMSVTAAAVSAAPASKDMKKYNDWLNKYSDWEKEYHTHI